eukprot:649236-Pleurochrysis_carterae.AAC.3
MHASAEFPSAHVCVEHRLACKPQKGCPVLFSPRRRSQFSGSAVTLTDDFAGRSNLRRATHQQQQRLLRHEPRDAEALTTESAPAPDSTEPRQREGGWWRRRRKQAAGPLQAASTDASLGTPPLQGASLGSSNGSTSAAGAGRCDDSPLTQPTSCTDAEVRPQEHARFLRQTQQQETQEPPQSAAPAGCDAEGAVRQNDHGGHDRLDRYTTVVAHVSTTGADRSDAIDGGDAIDGDAHAGGAAAAQARRHDSHAAAAWSVHCALSEGST